MGKITTIVFDMYETLAHNSQTLWLETFRDICLDQTLSVDHELLYREWKSLEMAFRRDRQDIERPENSPPFRSYEEAWRDCFVGAFSQLGLRGDASAAARRAVKDMGLREPYEDALEALPTVQGRWGTGVLSNADDGYLMPLLDRVGWEFRAVVSSERARAYKPLASSFWLVLDELGVGPEESVYVGDSLYDDVLGSKGVGMASVWMNRTGAPLDPSLPRPDRELRTLRELPEAIESLS